MVRFAPAIRPWRFRSAFREALRRMQSHHREKFNHEVFIESLAEASHRSPAAIDRLFRDSVERDFSRLGDRFGPIAGAREALGRASERGYRLVLATNPVFPLRAVQMRMAWGGIGDVPFDYITNSEVMTRCKPDVDYYHELLDRLSTEPHQCAMIGNDPVNDLPAHDAGIPTLLIEVEGADDGHERFRDDPRLGGRATWSDFHDWLDGPAQETTG
jgi:FMN phosphatase YigB (HAD superfamily)